MHQNFKMTYLCIYCKPQFTYYDTIFIENRNKNIKFYFITNLLVVINYLFGFMFVVIMHKKEDENKYLSA